MAGSLGLLAVALLLTLTRGAAPARVRSDPGSGPLGTSGAAAAGGPNSTMIPVAAPDGLLAAFHRQYPLPPPDGCVLL